MFIIAIVLLNIASSSRIALRLKLDVVVGGVGRSGALAGSGGKAS